MTELEAPTFNVAGAALWSRITGKYELRVDELDTLEDACRIADMIDSLTDVWDGLGRPTITKGSMGQEVIHPLVGEIRTQRAAKNALWRQLKLPDDEAAPAANQHRAAATSKWESRPTRGA